MKFDLVKNYSQKSDYPEKVRVVGFGESVRDDDAVAVEACCGT